MSEHKNVEKHRVSNDRIWWEKGVAKPLCHTFCHKIISLETWKNTGFPNDRISWQKGVAKRLCHTFCHTILAFGERWKKGIVVRMSILIVDFLVL